MSPTTHAATDSVRRLQWQEDATCRREELGLFFGAEGEPKRERIAREERAKAVCARCPVQVECLRHALAHPERYGVWGGQTEEERHEIRRTQRRAHEAA